MLGENKASRHSYMEAQTEHWAEAKLTTTTPPLWNASLASKGLCHSNG